MKFIRLFSLFAACIFATSLLAADVTGTWTGEVKLPTGQALPFVAHLKQDGNKITGKLDGINGAPDVEIVNGKIDGDTIIFSGVRQLQGNAVKFNYTGRVASETINFKIVRDDGTGAPLESMTKRTS